eukprot:CAMPEP_0198725796 /NCGR_PEP_ID=MMETSP1475-20131203/3033_1 /TAXON_ID= ORGANISM="Unidentified sp., Strain CCMP1999" /NCGR_SAMPLE_ID=MMETSP1475 /ASSEMBLY_ACC=CAM_ASM_001111 /LENGTH=199 /DNA_ID=CAMNT_0044487631 /DNA_START=117 /DNA_END=716 /DNA_ORIENTATION=+
MASSRTESRAGFVSSVVESPMKKTKQVLTKMQAAATGGFLTAADVGRRRLDLRWAEERGVPCGLTPAQRERRRKMRGGARRMKTENIIEEPKYDNHFDEPKYKTRRLEEPKYNNSRFEEPKYNNSRFEEPRYNNSRFEEPKYNNSRFDEPKYENYQLSTKVRNDMALAERMMRLQSTQEVKREKKQTTREKFSKLLFFL